MTWTAKDYVVGLIIFSALIALGFIMIQSLAIDYGNENIIDNSFNEHYNKFTETTQTAAEMFNKTSSKEGLGIIGTAEILLSSTFSVISLIFSSFTSLGSQVGHLAGDFGVPSQVASIIFVLFLSVITVGIVFIIINAVNKSGRL